MTGRSPVRPSGAASATPGDGQREGREHEGDQGDHGDRHRSGLLVHGVVEPRRLRAVDGDDDLDLVTQGGGLGSDLDEAGAQQQQGAVVGQGGRSRPRSQADPDVDDGRARVVSDEDVGCTGLGRGAVEVLRLLESHQGRVPGGPQDAAGAGFAHVIAHRPGHQRIHYLSAQINGVNFINKKLLLARLGVKKEDFQNECEKIADVLKLRIFDPRYLTEEGFVLSLYAF